MGSWIDIGTQPLETSQCRLRKFKTTDALAMFNGWCTDPRVVEFLTWNNHKNIEETRAILRIWIDKYQDSHTYRWVICDKKTKVPIGSIDCVKVDEYTRTCTMGYCLSSAYWGRGIMTEALRTVMAFLFDHAHFHRIQAKHHTLNPASGHVMAKAGMRLEGISKQSYLGKDNQYFDMAHYALLNEDYQKQKQKI